MNIPRSLKIGATRWKVSRPVQVDEDDSWGECTPRTQTLKVLRGIPEAAAADTLLHEILHAICAITLPGYSMKTQERFIRTITPMLLATIRDNRLDFSE